ncbi:MAG TPA: GntR family transcriptional regulator [Spirochaetia bacterium]|nr:GntR family transcriptional regulator [Spirochaetia bacterium]
MAVGQIALVHAAEKAPHQPIHQWVYRVLRAEIIELHIRPAQQISEKEVAVLLGISRTPVREAFIRLAEDGLLTITPQKRTAVTRIDLAQAEEARFVRRALEKAVMREVCGRLTETDCADMAAAIETQQESMRARAYDRMVAADNEFHRVIFRASHKERSWLYIKKMDYNYDRLRIMAIPLVIAQIIEEHRQILGILARGESDRVEQVVECHLASTAINNAIREFPAHYFTRAGQAAGAGAIGDEGETVEDQKIENG